MTDPTAYLRILGEPRLEGTDGTEVDLPLGKPFALLVYLVLSREPPSRDTLARLFWPDSTRERARGSVRQALWLVRNTLGDGLFVSDDPVEIRKGAVRTDVDELRQALSRDDIDRAHAFWEGPPLDSLRLVDLPEWERWLDTLRSELEQRLAEGAALRGNSERDAGHVASALEWFRRARQIQPHRAQHHLDLAETHLESRQFDQAAEAILVARRHLVDPQDLDPLAELEERLQTLRRGSLGDPLEDPSLRTEFVGRHEEFSALVRRWRQARRGHAAVGVVTGEDGMGKTRLTEEISLLARTEGGRTIQIRAADGERPIEWGLLGELVQQLMALSGAAGISHASDGMLRALLPSLTVGEPSSGHPRPRRAEREATGGARPSAALSDALHDLVTAVSEDAPLLIVVDDLHWADAESRAILARVATHLEAVPVCFLVTCRNCDEDARVEKTLDMLTDAPNGTVVALRPWTADEIEAIFGQLVSLSGSAEERELFERVARVCRGTPAFVVQLLERLCDDGAFEASAGGRGRLNLDRLQTAIPLPEGMRRWVRRRIPELSVPGVAVALSVARAAEPLSAGTIAQRTGLPAETVGAGIGELLELQIAYWEQGERLALVHREVATATIQHTEATALSGSERSSGWSRARTAALVGLVLLGATSATYLFGGPEPTAPPRIGEGSLFVVSSDSTYTIDTYGSPDPAWESGPPRTWFPVGPNIVGPFRTTSGELDWFENRFAAGSPSWILDLGSDGSDTTAIRHDRDERFLDLSPSGRFYLSISPNPDFPDTRDDLVMSVRYRSESWNFHRAEGKILSGDWSDDARAIALGVRTSEGDSLVVLGVTSERLAERGFDRIYNAVWCGNSRELVVLARHRGEARLLSWHIDSDVLQTLPSVGVLGTGLACAPDGSAVVFQAAVDGVPKYGLLDRASGTIHRLPIPEGESVEQLRWVPDEIQPVPVAVAVHEGETLTIEWGDRVQLGADLILSNWERVPGDVVWSTSDPEVASVTPEGEVTANTAGTTTLTARYGDWLRDELQITIEGEPTLGTLFSSTLGTLDRGDWLSVGMPRARPIQMGGRSALGFQKSLEPTGVISTQSFELPGGGTLEADFLVPGLAEPLPGGSPPSIRLCFLDADAPSSGNREGLEAESLHSWNVRQRVCFSYPHGTPSHVDPTTAGLLSHLEFPEVDADVSSSLPSEEWFQVALLLRSDGTARFFVDDELVGTTPVQVQNAPSVRWRVAVFGSGSDAVSPLVRDLTLSVGGLRKLRSDADESRDSD